MKNSKRLTLYLSSIGIQPNAVGAQAQYNHLGKEERKLARRTGRRLLIEFGSIARAIMALTNNVVQETPAAKSPPSLRRTRSREEQFLRNLSRWSPLTPPCPSCRMRCGFPKRSWPTRKWADEVRRRQPDRDTLRVFECPVQPDFWHLGHVGRHTVTSVTRDKALSHS
jgi:hypothetical protein